MSPSRFQTICLVAILGIFTSSFAFCQRVLLLETKNDPKSIKFYEGDKIEFKTVYNEEWTKGKIVKFLVQDSVILFNDAMLRIPDITHIRQYRQPINYISASLQTFGLGWMVYGTLASLSPSQKLDPSIYVVGGSSIALGWGLRKAFYKRNLTIGARYRLRLIDLSME